MSSDSDWNGYSKYMGKLTNAFFSPYWVHISLFSKWKKALYEPLLYFYLFLHAYVCMHVCIVCVHACVCAPVWGSQRLMPGVLFGSLCLYLRCRVSRWTQSSEIQLVWPVTFPRDPCLCLSNTGLIGRPVIPTDFSHGFWVCGCWSSCSSKHFIHQTISQPFRCVL